MNVNSKSTNLTPLLPFQELTVAHSRLPSKSSNPAARPVFDWLFWADAFVVSQKLSKESLGSKYARNFILSRANELAYRGRPKLSKSNSGSSDPIADFKEILVKLKEANFVNKHPALLHKILRKKLVRKTHKLQFVSKNEIRKESFDDVKDPTDLTDNQRKKSKQVNNQAEEAEGEFSELYDEMQLVSHISFR